MKMSQGNCIRKKCSSFLLNYSDSDMFIGLRRESGTWTWLDGSVIGTYANWKSVDGENDF